MIQNRLTNVKNRISKYKLMLIKQQQQQQQKRQNSTVRAVQHNLQCARARVISKLSTFPSLKKAAVVKIFWFNDTLISFARRMRSIL